MTEEAAGVPNDPTELQTVLLVREALVGLKRDMMTITEGLETAPHCDLNIRLRDARIRILELVMAPVHRSLRASDRFALQGLRTRIDHWLNGLWDDADAARRLLSDLRAFATLLHEVNSREVLMTYDRRVRSQALDALDDLAATLDVCPRDGWWRYLRVLRDADALRFRDDRLHHFVGAELKAEPRKGDRLGDSVKSARALIGDIRL